MPVVPCLSAEQQVRVRVRVMLGAHDPRTKRTRWRSDLAMRPDATPARLSQSGRVAS